MVGEGGIIDAAGAPTPQPRLQFVHRVPTEAPLPRHHVAKALTAICTDSTADMRASDTLLLPRPTLPFPARAARDPQRRVSGELAEQPLEVIRLERDIGVELHHYVGERPQHI